MAMRPLRTCNHPGCPELVQSGYCTQHTKDKQSTRLYDKQRGSNTARGYGYAWSLTRLQFLKANPLCHDCLNDKPEQVTPAKEVHHILAKRKGGKDDHDNLMSLCHRHHSIRTFRGE